MQKQRQTAEKLFRSRQVFVSVEWNIHPLEPLTMSFDLSSQWDDPAIATYAARAQRLIASTVKKLSLELDGNPPLIVFDDADTRKCR